MLVFLYMPDTIQRTYYTQLLNSDSHAVTQLRDKLRQTEDMLRQNGEGVKQLRMRMEDDFSQLLLKLTSDFAKQKKEAVQQLKQANDTAAQQPGELRQAENRERQLEIQLVRSKDDVSQLQKQKTDFEDRARQLQMQIDRMNDDMELQRRAFIECKQRSDLMWEQKIEDNFSSKIPVFVIIYLWLHYIT